MRLMFLLVALLSLLLGPLSAAARSWVYYDIREPKNQFVLESKPDRSAWLDIAGSAEFCGNNDLYQCFNRLLKYRPPTPALSEFQRFG